MNKTKIIIKTVIELVLVVALTTFIFHTVIIPIRVDGDSMYPTLYNDDTAMVSALNLNKDNINRFDIVVLQCDKLDKKIIKRVIGLPGETIVYKDDQLYINGDYYAEEFLDKSYIKKTLKESKKELFTDSFKYTLKDNEIFVLGDNRPQSADSRSLGTFKYKDILGKRGLVLFPFNHMKWME